MNLETILNAFELVCRQPGKWNYRQYRAFRARILCMDADKDKRIDVLCAEHDFLMDGSKELKAELDEKDKQIKELLDISTKERLARLEEDDD